MPRGEHIGRIIGIAGATCASLFWGIALFAVAHVLIEPRSVAGIALIIAMPAAIFASLLFVVAAADVVVLARRVDFGMPARVAALHVVMAAIVLWLGAHNWRFALILLAIAASQLVAIYLFRQITPSHASSQR